jgi:peroxiredoxin
MLSLFYSFIKLNQFQNIINSILYEIKSDLDTVQSIIKSIYSIEIPEGLEVGVKAPDFTLTDTEGQMVTLQNFLGNRVLLGFTSIDCEPCKKLYSDLKGFGGSIDNVYLVIVSLDPADKNLKLKKDYKFDFPILTSHESVMMSHEVPGTPFFYLIDEKGLIIKKGYINSLTDLKNFVRQ